MSEGFSSQRNAPGQKPDANVSSEASAAAILRAPSASHAEMARRARAAQRETLTPAVQEQLGLERPSLTPGIRRNSSAPLLSRADDGLPKIIIGICGAF
jgi:hypothetical protein